MVLAISLALGSATEVAWSDPLVPLPGHPVGLAWPTDAWPRGELPLDIDPMEFEAAVEGLFEAVGRGGLSGTRALLVALGGRLVYERYAEGFGATSRFQSWSMAKSVTQSQVGILVRQGKLNVAGPAPVPAWREPGDPRGGVTLDDLLHMTSGLANADGFEDGLAFVGEALFGRGERERLAFMRRELFRPFGMQSAVPEFDSAGHFMGGAFLYASAQDWARFGYLYLRDGVWDGRRILPEGGVDYSRTPAQTANNGIHGAHFWTNAPPTEGQWTMYPGAPVSVFAVEGNGFQVVLMAPDRDLRVVRLGELLASDFPEQRRRIGKLVSSFPVLAERGARGAESCWGLSGHSSRLVALDPLSTCGPSSLWPTSEWVSSRSRCAPACTSLSGASSLVGRT